jgi:hypothetical protein
MENFDVDNVCDDFGEQFRAPKDVSNWVRVFASLLAPATASKLSVMSGGAQTAEIFDEENFEEIMRALCQKIEAFLSDDYCAHQDATWVVGHFAKTLALMMGRKVLWESMCFENKFDGEASRKENIRFICKQVVQMLHHMARRIKAGDLELAV